MNYALLKYVSSIAVTVLVLYFLFKGIHINELKENFVVSLDLIAISLLVFVVIKILNTLRFSVVYNTDPNKELFWTLCYSNMMLSIFPFRLGELSYISRLQRMTKKTYTDVTTRLIKIRLFDYVSIYLILMLSSIYVYAAFSDVVKIISLFFVASLILGLLLVLLIFRYNLIRKIPITKISKILTTLDQEVKSGFYTTPKNEVIIFIYSIGYWLVRLMLGYVILLMLGINLPFLMIAFISLAVFLVSLIPIQFIAGFGITEAGFLFFLTQLGFDHKSTLIILINYHLYLLIPVVFYGLLSLCISTKKHIKD